MSKRIMKKTETALLLAAAVTVFPASLSGGLTSLAASPVTEYDEATLEKFRDNVLEYWEIPGLIEQYNAGFLNDLEKFYNNPGGSTGLSKTQLLDLAKELRSEADELSRDAEYLKDEISKEAYQEYQNNIRALRLSATQFEKESEGRTSSGLAAVWGLKELRDKQTKAARELMRTYHSQTSQLEIKKKNLEIAENSYQTAKTKQGIQMAVQEDILKAEEALNEARGALKKAEADLKSTKQNLCIMLGWSYDAEPEIRPAPKADQSVIASFHPETDDQTAINNNYTLRTKRRTPTATPVEQGGFGGRNNKDRMMRDFEDTVRFSLNQLYQTILQKQKAYEAAAIAFEKAENDKASADLKTDLKMTTRLEQMQAEAAYLTAKADFETADMELLAAIEEYEWALKGLLSLDEKEGA